MNLFAVHSLGQRFCKLSRLHERQAIAHFVKDIANAVGHGVLDFQILELNLLEQLFGDFFECLLDFGVLLHFFQVQHSQRAG